MTIYILLTSFQTSSSLKRWRHNLITCFIEFCDVIYYFDVIGCNDISSIDVTTYVRKANMMTSQRDDVARFQETNFVLNTINIDLNVTLHFVRFWSKNKWIHLPIYDVRANNEFVLCGNWWKLFHVTSKESVI